MNSPTRDRAGVSILGVDDVVVVCKLPAGSYLAGPACSLRLGRGF